ncbi:MAG: hypothetical protein ACRD3L_18210 [Terriglobales bacterium]
MKRTLFALLAGILMSGLLTSPANAQDAGTRAPDPSANAQEPSLGSYARAVKKEKKPPAPAKKWDNDNLPKDDKISIVGAKTTASADDAAAPMADAQPAATPGDKLEVQPGQSQEQRQGVYDQWQQRISTEQAQVDLLSRELDVEQREYRVRSAAFYADAGDRLRNQAAWDKEDADYKQKIADKQKSLDEAKQKVTDMQEDARKSGVPSAAREAATQPESQQ